MKIESLREMKQLLITIAAVVLVGCGESSKNYWEVTGIWKAAEDGNIEAVKQHLAAGTDVNAKNRHGNSPLQLAALMGHKEIVELLIAKGADVNAKGPQHKSTPCIWRLEGITRKSPNYSSPKVRM